MDTQHYYNFPNFEPIPIGMVQPVHIARHLSFNKGAVVKYVSRAGRKTADPLPDLLKALDHLQDEIALVREQQASEKATTTLNPNRRATTVTQLAADDPAGVSSVLNDGTVPDPNPEGPVVWPEKFNA